MQFISIFYDFASLLSSLCDGTISIFVEINAKFVLKVMDRSKICLITSL